MIPRNYTISPDAPPHGFVNFANRNFGYGKFTHGCTQEEILQVCCPEFNVGMLYFGAMPDDAVVLVHNVRRYTAYEGFKAGFVFKGPVSPRGDKSWWPQTILTLDAVFERHFHPESVERDVKKAFTAFLGVFWEHHLETSPAGTVAEHFLGVTVPPQGGTEKLPIRIATGLWGCGAFRGNVYHKFLQQWVAARMVNEHLSRLLGSGDGAPRMTFLQLE